MESDSDNWAPRPNPAADVKTLPLTAPEGFVLSRLDGSTSLERLQWVTGFPLTELRALVMRLVTHGAVIPPPAVSGPTAAPSVAPPPAASASSSDPADDEESTQGLTFRALFEQRLHALSADQRAELAQTASDPELSAYCFDPVPAVIRAVLQNSQAGLTQARLIARNHRHPAGLEGVVERAAFVADSGVRRWLVRNPQLSASLARRLFQSKRLLEQYKLSQDRDIPEGTRRTLRETMRSRFSSALAEERVELIITTEGRALASLSGLPVDGKTTAMLCARPHASTLLIRNIARWSAAPPALIAHLLRQEAVRRQPSLRQMLQRHPNAPASSS